MNEIIGTLNQAFTLAFVVTSMFGLGLGLTVRDLLAPLRNGRLVAAALGISFVLLPALAWLLVRVLPIAPDLGIGLILMSAVAGAPLAIKATQMARGDNAVAASLVVLLVVATVAYLPFALPWLVPGVEVDAMAIALPLFIQILLPLAAGLLVNLRYDKEAESTRVVMGEISNLSLALMLIFNLANVPQVLDLFGSGAIGSALAIILVGLGAGYLLGGSAPEVRRTLALASAQRNYAAAFVIAQGSFAAQPDVFLMVLAASLISMGVVLVAAGEFGRRAGRVAAP
ncbi:bile acid:sodium symporter family protein [Aerolutibacter ruishenii]|uniref:BASS family bile acid:Na+ symporter n=1 Tax=Aerolutibacter ruishenii TaxID=686800 RepID=A0A562LCI1_9GAMM|nr:bile acid:sodium symporter [Lysobacter ruishenii]TWI05392.1 BASS family bile acid:Na+ symporter [Lysobacter ruishenii]